MNRKSERLSREITKYLAMILHRQEWPADRLTVIHSDLSEKCDYAHVYVSVWPESSEQKTIQELNSRKGLIKKELASKLKARLMPEIGFYLDHSSEIAIRIAQLLDETEK
jgi:ribosome-binding factor A